MVLAGVSGVGPHLVTGGEEVCGLITSRWPWFVTVRACGVRTLDRGGGDQLSRESVTRLRMAYAMHSITECAVP